MVDSKFELMKKYILIPVAAIAFAACNINENEPQAQEEDKLHTRIEQDTKTTMDKGNNILWSEGDLVKAFMKTSYGYKYQLVSSFAGLTYGDFERIDSGSSDRLSGGVEWDHNVVYYPYSEDVKVVKAGTDYTLEVSLPAEQTFVPESFDNGFFPMVAVSETNDITFRNICGGVKLQFKGTREVTSIEFEGKNGEKLAGAAVVTAYSDGQKPSVSMEDDALTSVILDCGEGVALNEDTATEFIIALPPVEFGKGFTVSVTTSDGQTTTFETDAANVILRSSLLVMPALTLENTPQEPEDAYYVEVAENFSDWSGDYLITYTTGSTVTVFDSFDDDKGTSDTDLISSLTSEGIHSDYGDPYKAVVSKVGEGYSVYLTNVGYLGLESSNNSLSKSSSAPSASDTKYLWKFSYKDGGSVWMKNLANTERRLQWNASASIFRCYTGGQKEITLYRRSTSTGSTTPSPDPDIPDTPDTPITPDPDPTPDNGGNSSGYLQCYDVPYVSTSLPAGSGYSSKVAEIYGNTYAYIYETTDASQRVVTHTFSNGGKTHRNYTFLYDYDKHCPLWLSYHLNSGYCGTGGSRTNAWAYDPAIPTDEQPNLKSSYCSGGNPYNRGHMIASHARSAITVANQQAFYYTNMTPQASSNFNTGGGCWNDLEDAEMGILPSGRDTLYVVTGCVFEDGYKTISNVGDGLVCAVPDQFYKCFMLCSFDSSGKMTSAKAVGYLMPHDSPLNSGYSQYAKTIDAIEAIAGYDFFTNVPSELQTTAESKITSIGL